MICVNRTKGQAARTSKWHGRMVPKVVLVNQPVDQPELARRKRQAVRISWACRVSGTGVVKVSVVNVET